MYRLLATGLLLGLCACPPGDDDDNDNNDTGTSGSSSGNVVTGSSSHNTASGASTSGVKSSSQGATSQQGQSSSAQSHVASSGAATSGTATSGTATSDTVTSGTATSDTVTSGTATSDTATSGSATSDTVTSGAATSGTTASSGVVTTSSSNSSNSSSYLHCPGYVAPDESGGSCTCRLDGGTCDPNNCYGGYYCNTNLTPNKCVRAPTSCEPVNCPGFYAPDQTGGNCECKAPAGVSCTANNCYGGYYCDSNQVPGHCVQPPTSCEPMECDAFIPPDQAGGSCTCRLDGGTCDPNNCFGGYYCNTNVTPNRCQALPPTCGGGSTDGGTTANCGTVTSLGECNENEVRVCLDGELVTYSCDTYLGGVPAVCKYIHDDWGYDCAVTGNGECVFEDDTGESFVAFCADPGAGCVIDVYNNTTFCSTTVGACTIPTENPAPTCSGNVLQLDCSYDQPMAFACAPGSCQNGQCIEPAGGPCDQGTDALFVCEGTMSCVVQADESFACE